MGKKFHKSLMGGFRKKDVITYLEAAASQRQEELRERDHQLEESAKALTEAETRLKQERDAADHLREQLRQQEQAVREREQQLRQAELARRQAVQEAEAAQKEALALKRALEQKERSYAALTQRMRNTSRDMREKAVDCVGQRKEILEGISRRLDQALNCLQQLVDQQKEEAAALEQPEHDPREAEVDAFAPWRPDTQPEEARPIRQEAQEAPENLAEPEKPAAGEEKKRMSLEEILRMVREGR